MLEIKNSDKIDLMGTYIFTSILFFTMFAHGHNETGAIGVEGGIAQLRYQGKNGIGPSWNFHAEINFEPRLGFFGDAGKISAMERNASLKQTAFTGGIFFEPLPIIDFRLGLATTVVEFEEGNKNKHLTELGPLAGVSLFLRSGVWKYGASGTVIHTGSMQSYATRFFAHILF